MMGDPLGLKQDTADAVQDALERFVRTVPPAIIDQAAGVEVIVTIPEMPIKVVVPETKIRIEVRRKEP